MSATHLFSIHVATDGAITQQEDIWTSNGKASPCPRINITPNCVQL